MTEDFTRTSRSRNKPRKPHRAREVVAVLALLAFVGVMAAAAGLSMLKGGKTDVTAGRPVQITIAQGASTASIAQQLADKGVVSSSFWFRFKARQSGLDSSLKPGTYELKTGMSDELVLQQLQKGPNVVYYDVPIPEGFTIEQIAARFAARAHVSEDEMLALARNGAAQFQPRHPYLSHVYDGSLQGYLFPKTYRVKKGTKPEAIIEMMLDQFDAEMADIDLKYAKSKGLDLNEVVTLASIIEREVRLAREYPLVSSVIYNRLDAGMRLQLDSTVFYFLPRGTKVITKADLANQNPFNTYQHAGLPPGPLANPGARALKAAAKPAKTKYYYYVLTGKDGSQTFATNYADFMVAVAKYRRTFVTPKK